MARTRSGILDDITVAFLEGCMMKSIEKVRACLHMFFESTGVALKLNGSTGNPRRIRRRVTFF